MKFLIRSLRMLPGLNLAEGRPWPFSSFRLLWLPSPFSRSPLLSMGNQVVKKVDLIIRVRLKMITVGAKDAQERPYREDGQTMDDFT